MFDENNRAHLNDLEIILEADAELPHWHARQVREHLATCWTCRARKAHLDEGVSSFVNFYHRQYGGQIPSVDGPRSLLQARLAEIRTHDNRLFWRRFLTLLRMSMAAACAFAVLVGVLAFSLHNRRPPAANRSEVARSLMPDERITPGAASPVTREFVCHAGTFEAGPIDDSVARQVFRRYRLPNPSPGAYEVDYVIPPALGGSRNVENLWPQPYSQGEWNSHIKDALEQKLESLVCAGKLDVQQAQRDLAKNWIAAYKAYFNSEKPLLDHLAFAKDRPYLSGARGLEILR